MKFENQIALITGGARVGQVVATELSRRGMHVAMTYHNSRKSAEETSLSIQKYRRKSLLIKSDLNGAMSAHDVVQQVKKKFGQLHVLICMASIYRSVPLERLRAKDWEENVNVNLRSAYELSLKAAPLMRTSGGGRMIYVSDWTAESGRPRYKNFLPYYVSKSGIKGLTEGLALELAPEILVNVIAPGPILAPSGLSKTEASQVVKETPLRRWGGAEEIAKAVTFLIESDFITGESIRVDGGRHLY